MANFKYINDDEHIELVMEGSLSDLLSNVCTMVHTIYEKLPEKAAESFKKQITDAFDEGLPFMTNDEIAEKAKEIAPKALEKILGELRDALKNMQEDNEDA